MLQPIYTEITTSTFLICALTSLVLGLFMCLIYSYSHRARKDFTSTLLLMPFIISVVLLTVNSMTTSFVIVSIFALTRFRTVQYKAEEIMSIFASVVLGLLCATGYIYLAILFAVVYSLVLTVYNKISIRTHKMLKVVIPENTPFSTLDEPISKYTSFHQLVNYKTTNLGSLYKLTYDIVESDNFKPQEFIDAIRLLNGNLEVEIAEFAEVKD